MLTDTHAHLDFPDFQEDLPSVLDRARAVGVTRFITIGTTLESSQSAARLASEMPGVYATVGIHPSNADEVAEGFIAQIASFAKRPRIVAMGECGLDYHRLPSSRMHEAAVATVALGNETPVDIEASIADGAVKSQQADVFRQQLDLASELNLPVVIHERDAWDDTLSILREYTGKVRAVFHCFGKSIEQAEEVIALGHLVSFTGIVTFKNAQVVQETAARLPAGKFMVETDCPYLAPAPNRGKRCEPAFVKDTAAFIARLRGVELEALARETEATAEAFFRFQQ